MSKDNFKKYDKDKVLSLLESYAKTITSLFEYDEVLR